MKPSMKPESRDGNRLLHHCSHPCLSNGLRLLILQQALQKPVPPVISHISVTWCHLCIPKVHLLCPSWAGMHPIFRWACNGSMGVAFLQYLLSDLLSQKLKNQSVSLKRYTERLKLNDFSEMSVPAALTQLRKLTNVASSLCLAS